MRKLWSLLLCVCLLAAALPASQVMAEENLPAVEPVTETIRPGKATLLAFTVPESGPVSLRMVDGAGETVSTVVEGYWASAGRNELMWNGTYESVFAPAGTWQLELSTGEGAVSTTVTVGQAAPYLTNLMSSVELSAQTMTVTFYASVDGLLSVGAVVNGAWTPLDSRSISAGENIYIWDMSAANPATSALTLTLSDAAGFPSNEEHIAVSPEDFGWIAEPTEAQPTAAPEETATEEPEPEQTEAPTEEPAEEATAEPDPEPEETIAGLPVLEDLVVGELIIEEVMMDEPESDDQSVFTPSYGSPYTGQDTSLNYWTLPMDITNEEAVWEVLMQPITILYSSRDKADRTQVVIRKEPDESSQGLGVVTRINQGVHVLETLDNGWSLIECYSASFHDSAVKAWNILVQGYVKTEELRTVEPQTEYGIVIDKLTQRLYLFKEGHLYSTLMVSTGLANADQPYNETRSGEFLLTSAVGAFASGNLTCAMAIRFDSGDLLHEVPHKVNADGSKNYSYAEPQLGSRASHGCIRVQRRRTPEGINMTWLWNNRVKNTKVIIWEDWQGRQIPYPDNDLTLYYNPAGGSMYHSKATCYSAEGKTFSSFTYGELELSPYDTLNRCTYCAPAMRRSEIDAINANYLPGGDHDPILTQARQKYYDSLEN
ncbi:MAG: L,D-transpeptidase family protein [Christensenellaceae bacterium]|nr:L,D-transpeptidase family protein [Christensenellaceae bacterium]